MGLAAVHLAEHGMPFVVLEAGDVPAAALFPDALGRDRFAGRRTLLLATGNDRARSCCG